MEFFTELGGWAIHGFWIPVFLWTLVSGTLEVCTSYLGSRYPSGRADVRLALLASLPMGIIAYQLVSVPSNWGIVELPGVDTAILQSYAPTVAFANTPRIMWQDGFGLVFALLMAVAIFRLVLLAVAAYRLSRSHRTNVSIRDNTLQEKVDRIRISLKTQKAIRVVRSLSAEMPYSSGVKRPLIVIPMGWPSEKLDTVLWHEVLHHHRGDVLKTWISQVVAAVFGFHPLVNRLKSKLVVDVEIACDQDVLTLSETDVRQYAAILLEAVRVGKQVNRLSLPILASKNELKQRFTAMKIFSNSTRPTLRATHIRVVAVLLFAGMTLLGACSSSYDSDLAETLSSGAPSDIATVGQGKVSGTVTDQYDAPLANIVVSVDGAEKSATTDEQGRYYLIVPEGTQEIQFQGGSLSSAASVKISSNYTSELNVKL